MHLTMALIASIGYIFGDGGLKSMLVEAEVYGENSCKIMLEGKQYSRAIRGLTLTADALSRLLFTSLDAWCKDTSNNVAINDKLQNLAEKIDQFFTSNVDKRLFQSFEESTHVLRETLEEFVLLGYSSSTTFKYWHTFIQSVDLLWKMLYAERDANFNAHFCAVQDSLPVLMTAGRNLYVKWIPVYLNDMENLKSKVPHMYQFLDDGNFVVKKGNERKFNCVASDMALEQSINRDCKSSSGVIGFTRNPSALLRWIVTRHILGDYSQNFLGKS